MFARSVLLGVACALAGCSSAVVECEAGVMVTCYRGPEGTQGVGVCRAGSTLCSAKGTLGTCEGAVEPSPELCDGDDNDCDGQVDEGVTNACGGCTELPQQPGEPCPPCGKWTCAGREGLVCSGGRLNNCGVCNEPDVAGLNASCVGADGCQGATACADAGTSALCLSAKKNNCGVCGAADVPSLGATCTTGGCTGMLACSPSGLGSVCGGPGRNNCNACALPDVTGLGEPCALSGPGCGVRACNAAGDGTECVASQVDPDSDGVADPCDTCPTIANPVQTDSDGDGFGNACDTCPAVGNPSQTDGEGDGVGDACDNCPTVVNAGQGDVDRDGQGDACDSDGDGDGTPNAVDNCPTVVNGSQLDVDGDGLGDACDNCPAQSNGGQVDADGDGKGDACDNCPALGNPGQSDGDSDGAGDACDNCPASSNAGQANGDADGWGDACDNCPTVASANQTDVDGDGKGDVCDVLLSELAAAGGGGADDEFVELFNPSAQPVPLAGWVLQYRAASGASWQVTTLLPAGASIPARGFYLVGSGGTGGYSGAPAADFLARSSTGTPRALSYGATGGNVRLGVPGASTSLPNTDPLISDTVGWGTAVYGEGSAAPVGAWGSGAPYTSASIERKASASSTSATMVGAEATAGNGRDSQDNAQDWVTRAARGPQSSASAPEP